MSNRDANYIISGSGVSGLISALILCEKSLGHKTVIIEKSATLGGLLKKYNYGNFGDFDYGMHNFLETGIHHALNNFEVLICDLKGQGMSSGERNGHYKI
jgi:protoporphyrinogen oxidase